MFVVTFTFTGAKSHVILATEEVITANLKVILTTTKVILITEKVITKKSYFGHWRSDHIHSKLATLIII